MIKESLYEKFVSTHPAGNFFQSLVFAKFQEKIPYRGKAWTILEGEGTAQSSCLAIRQKLPLGFCKLWVPYGPIEFNEKIFAELLKISKGTRAIFARIEPGLGWLPEFTTRLKSDWNIVPTQKRYTPQHTLILDLNKTEDEILAQMKPKGRYNIKIAEKHDIKIKEFFGWDASAAKDFAAFHDILKETSARDGFGVHPQMFYQNLLETFGKQSSSLFLAYYKGKVVAGLIAIFYKDFATYYYGGSDYAHRNFMAPYLLQWHAILSAKKRGMNYYDFLGIAPDDSKPHDLSGVTQFKKKFGGRQVAYPEAFDLVFRPTWYKILSSIKKLH
ncbi:MAG: peptidoglycan bridge formation glycyltransferase FemA/FemB family protein [Candidatus Gracilibacteria bacterium]